MLIRMKTNSLWLSIGISQLLFVILLPIWLRLLSYLHPVVLLVVWMCLTILVLFVVYSVRRETLQISKTILKSVIGIYSLGLFVLLFFRPANQEYSQINFIPFKTIIGFLTGNVNFLVAFYNLAANIFLFAPFGVATLMLYKKPSKRQLWFVPVVAILLIETTQHLTRRGTADIDDLILNLLGVWMGYFLYPFIQKVVKVKDSEA
ncbi:VanZ family protein [Neobacillus sp. NPDC058068]|uniref:VanZ family protein n=1 Tax=Neobacillus sp. NPDC058068 TaxID=3346325 RepID=UPI0036DF9D54